MKKIIATTIITTAISSNLFAADSTIFKASDVWQQSQHHKIMLSKAPEWDDALFTRLYHYFKQNYHSNTPTLIENNKDHVDFINFNWGPESSPYQQYKRPAKLFVFIGDHPKRGEFYDDSKDNYYIAPIIRNAADKQYYIFEKGLDTPILLDAWLNTIVKKTPHNQSIRINVCEHYATGPDDHCGDMPYESEAHYVHNDYVPEDYGVNRLTLSSKRHRGESWEHAAERNRKLNGLQNSAHSLLNTSANWHDPAQRNAMLRNVVSWPNDVLIHSIFKTIRDIRYFTDFQDSAFKRRITWLMPEDGCWSRVAAFIKDFFGPKNNPVTTYNRPSKIFAFGNLCVNSKNAVDGYALWWFHVAPIIRNAATNAIYVLDPSVDAQRPLLVEDWMARISDNTGKCAYDKHYVNKFSICNGYGLMPWKDCESTPASEESYGSLEQMLYMQYETSNQLALGKNPKKTLGDSPPWLTKIKSPTSM